MKVERVMRILAGGLAVAGLLLLLALAFFTLLDGLLRAFANYPLDFVREVGDLVAALCGASCLPIVLLERGNITLRVLDKFFSQPIVKIVDLINAILMEVVLIAIAWQFYLYGVKTMRGGEITWLLNIPKAPFWFAIDAILWIAVAMQCLLVIQQLLQFHRTRSQR